MSTPDVVSPPPVHCWDYRRFVVSGAGRAAADELAAADRLIETNFSNYSSWHYRSHLLTELFPARDGAAPIAEDRYLKGEVKTPAVSGVVYDRGLMF